MTNDQLETILAAVPVEIDEQGWSVPPAERLLTLYVAHDGVSLTVSKVEGVKLQSELLHARTKKRELYIVPVASVFALAVEGEKTSERKAGFAADR